MSICTLWGAFGVLCVYSNHCKTAVIDTICQQYLTLMMAFLMGV